MAIDPMMYKKYSGKSGDPYAKMGAALAQSDARASQREAERHANRRGHTSLANEFKGQVLGISILVLLFGGVFLLWAIFG
jgi:hypothetical protein